MRRPSSFNVFLGSVIALGGAIIVGVLVLEGPVAMLGPRPDLFLTFSGLLLLAESRPVMWLRRKQGAVITAAPSFNAALLFLAPGLGAAVASGLISAVGDTSCGRPPVKTAFNAAMMTITMSASSLVLLVLGGDRIALIEGGAVTPLWLVVSAVALVGYNVVNDVQVSTIIALSERLPVLGTIRKDIIRNLQTDGVLLALGPVMVLLAVRSILLLPVLLAVTIIVLNTTRVALQRLHQATHDPLTGLPNRRLFDEHLAEVLGARADKPLLAMAIDLDRFKEINDTLGHEIGDRVLIAVADRLQAAVPHSAMVARLGGDEFAIVMTDGAQVADPQAVGDQIHRAFTGSLEAEGLPLTVGGSVGVAVRDHETSVSQMMRRADLAMYRAKATGGGVAVHTDDGHEGVQAGRLSLVDQLTSAIEDGQLLLHYQPVVDARTRDVVSVEALVRWQHPELGMVPPGSFIPTVEQTDLIEPLTTFVLRQALQDVATFVELGHDISVAVNLSSRSVTDLGFPRHLRQLLAESGVASSRLTLELTENTILTDAERATQVLAEIRGLGVRLALDDFGTGYSSLSNLRDLPLDTVKVDRSFVTTMSDKPDDEAIVAMVLQLAHRMGLQTVAEGVEDGGVAEHLVRLGCTHLQGFHVSRPLPFEALAAWMTDRGHRPTTILKQPAARARSPHEVSPT